MIGVVIFVLPAVLLAAAGISSWRRTAPHPITAKYDLALAVTTGGAAWFAFAGLQPHEIDEITCRGRCPTVFGWDAPLADPGPLWLTYCVVIIAAAALIARRGRLQPVEIGSAIIVVSLVTAWWTAPRGDNDGLWTLVFMYLPFVGAGGAAAAAAVRSRTKSGLHEADR